MNGATGKDLASRILLGLSLVAGVVMLFTRPFAIGPPAFVVALVGSALATRDRRFGLAATGLVTLCFLIGAAIAVWNSNALY